MLSCIAGEVCWPCQSEVSEEHYLTTAQEFVQEMLSEGI